MIQIINLILITRGYTHFRDEALEDNPINGITISNNTHEGTG